MVLKTTNFGHTRLSEFFEGWIWTLYSGYMEFWWESYAGFRQQKRGSNTTCDNLVAETRKQNKDEDILTCSLEFPLDRLWVTLWRTDG